MKRTLLFAGPCVVLSIVVACASPSDMTLGQFEDAGGTTSVVPPEEDASSDPPRDAGSPPVRSSCSDAGWCATELPDDDLDIRDVWPLETRAFAIAESRSLGVKTLEWDATNGWRYIDDNTQNAYGFEPYAGTLWAPSDNELYYGVAQGFIYHGTRATPSSPWSWERSRLDDHGQGPPALARSHLEFRKWADSEPANTGAVGVWGASSGDVYAWYANALYHREVDDEGLASWNLEHVVDDPSTPNDALYILSAAGSGPQDIWLSGARASLINGRVFVCPIVVHKTPSGYSRMVDHTVRWSTQPAETCSTKAGYKTLVVRLSLFGMTFEIPSTLSGYLPRLTSTGVNAAAGVQDSFLVFMRDADTWTGTMNTVAFTPVHYHVDVPTNLSSLWVDGDRTWLSGWGAVLTTQTAYDQWSAGVGIAASADAGGYELSSIALDGITIDVPIHQIRGTSNTNLWAVGKRYALHKTTP